VRFKRAEATCRARRVPALFLSKGVIDPMRLSAGRSAILGGAALLLLRGRAGAVGRVPEDRRITVVFRFDDYSSRSPAGLESKLIDAFRKHRLRCTFGVIPSITAGSVSDPASQKLVPLPPFKTQILREAVRAGILEVAQHGTSHQMRRGLTGIRFLDGFLPYRSEFSGIDRDVQLREVAKGKDLLEKDLGIRVVTFIPPWNSYDLNTLRALEQLGFKSLSAARHGPADPLLHLRLLPCTCDPAGLRRAVESARRLEDPHAIIVVLIHPGDFREGPGRTGQLTIQGFEKLLGWVAAQKDVQVRTIGESVAGGDDHGASRFLANRGAFLWGITPAFLERTLPAGARLLYLSAPLARATRTKLRAVLAAYYLGTFLLSALLASRAGVVLFPRLPPASKAALALACVAGALLIPGAAGASLIVALLGACVGAWGFFLRSKGSGSDRSP